MMAYTNISYNPDMKIYEALCPNGQLMTYFVFPVNLKAGDTLPPLRTHCFHGGASFTFRGYYNDSKDNLEFVVDGPVGYSFKASLQVDSQAEGSYSWKMKKHGILVGSDKATDESQFIIPRSLCHGPLDMLLDSERAVVKRWCFYGRTVLERFGRLRLKLKFLSGRFQGKEKAASTPPTILGGDSVATGRKTGTKEAGWAGQAVGTEGDDDPQQQTMSGMSTVQLQLLVQGEEEEEEKEPGGRPMQFWANGGSLRGESSPHGILRSITFASPSCTEATRQLASSAIGGSLWWRARAGARAMAPECSDDTLLCSPADCGSLFHVGCLEGSDGLPIFEAGAARLPEVALCCPVPDDCAAATVGEAGAGLIRGDLSQTEDEAGDKVQTGVQSQVQPAGSVTSQEVLPEAEDASLPSLGNNSPDTSTVLGHNDDTETELSTGNEDTPPRPTVRTDVLNKARRHLNLPLK